MAQICTELNANMSPDQYNTILNELDSKGLSHPSGRIYHVAVQKGSSMEIISIWESEKSFEDFSRTLFPILEKQGISARKPDVLPVYRILQ